jgi:integrase/recombinase XerD
VFDRRGSRKYLNANERHAYLQWISGEPDPLRRAFCLTLFYTGCRISEASNLTAGRVDLTAKAVVFETLKQRKRGCFRSVPVPDELADLLKELVTQKDPETKMWGFSRATGYRLIKNKMEQANVSGGMACPKGLRHGHAVACVSGKIPLTTIKKWLEHARIETTAIYLEVSGDEERELAKRLWVGK